MGARIMGGTRRPRNSFETGVAVALFLGAAAFVLLLAGVGSGLITEEEPDAGSALYESGPRAGDDGGAAASGVAEFAITAVNFEGGGFVEITNVGGAPGSLSGWWLCQRPSYGPAGDADVAPGESVRVTPDVGYGSLRAEDGEIGLYRDSSFGSAASIASYVEWGGSGHGRSATAVEAGIWDGGSVATGGAAAISAPAGATSAAGWTTG